MKAFREDVLNRLRKVVRNALLEQVEVERKPNCFGVYLRNYLLFKYDGEWKYYQLHPDFPSRYPIYPPCTGYREWGIEAGAIHEWVNIDIKEMAEKFPARFSTDEEIITYVVDDYLEANAADYRQFDRMVKKVA